MSDLFYVNNSIKSHLDYYKEKKRVQRSKESLEDKEIRLRQIREYARMRRFIENESPAHREASLNDERQRSQQRLANESEAQREVRLEVLRQRSQQQWANESVAEGACLEDLRQRCQQHMHIRC